MNREESKTSARVYQSFDDTSVERITTSSYAAEATMTDQESLTDDKILNLHIHLGHASADQLWRTLKNAGRICELERIRSVLGKCRCDKNKFALQRTLIHSNGPLRCGEVIGIDILYPVFGTGRRLPFLIIVCMISRYTLACRLASRKPADITDGLFSTWLQTMGRPERIISDKATAFRGPKWGEFLSTFDLEYVSSSANTPHENGLVERAVSLVKIGYETIRRSRAGISHASAMAWACMAKMSPRW